MIAVENAIALFGGKRPPTILNPEVLRQQYNNLIHERLMDHRAAV